MAVIAPKAVDAEQLRSAFRVFNQQSDVLERSYRDLQNRVEILTSQLQQARSARHKELVTKERLSQRLELLLETIPGAIIVIDGDGIIQEQNSEALSLLNEPLRGCSWASVVRREVRAGGSEDGNIQLRDGRWLSLARRSLKREPGEILLLADVTESRQMSALRQRKERLTAIGEMTAEFAHQVRTPLASAMLYVSQLRSSNRTEQRVAKKLVERLSDLGRMVDDMLGFASGAKRSDETVSALELLEAIRSTVDVQLSCNSELTLLVDGRDITTLAAETNSFNFAANGDALKGALINLVMNADQAAVGPVQIQLGAWCDGKNTYFTVSDNGPGIRDDVLPRLFEPFFTTRPQGTGLGLAVVQEVARAHSGDVSVAVLNRGTRFTLRLPIFRCFYAGERND